MTKRDGEGGFFQRPDKTWTFRVVAANGRRVSGTGRTQKEAKTAAMERARLVAAKPATSTVSDVIDEWLAQSPESLGLRPTTRDQYKALLRRHVEPPLGEVRLVNLSRRMVADTVRGFNGSASTRRSTYAALVKLMDYAVASGVLAVNVARETPRPPASQSRDRAVAPEAAPALLAAADGHRWGIASWLAFGCGLRRGEALALRWADIDFGAGELAVNGNVTRSSAGLVRGAPKTRRGTRRVPIPGAVLARLAEHRARQDAEREAAVLWVDHDLVLTNEIGGTVEPRSLSRAWAGWARSAGMKDRGTHTGRHYAASTLLSSGAASVADVAAVLGHDPAVLLNTYAVAVADGQRRASDVLGDSLTKIARANFRANATSEPTDDGER